MNPISSFAGILALLVLVTAQATLYTIEEGQQVVILQFGRPVGGAIREAGLHWKLPFIQEIRRFDKRLRWPRKSPQNIAPEYPHGRLSGRTARISGGARGSSASVREGGMRVAN